MHSNLRRLGCALLLAAALGTPARTAPRSAPGCEFSRSDTGWVQRALDGWEVVRRDFLHLDAAPLPWIVLFDASCVWHIAADTRLLGAAASSIPATLTFAGAPVDVRAARHNGTILLPSGVEIAAAEKASTALYRNGRAPFFVMAVPSVWRADRRHASTPHLDEYLQGVMTHEMTHTRQVVAINRRLREVLRTTEVAPLGLNDDVIQARFQREPGFARAVKRERDLFFRAAMEKDPAKRKDLAGRALAMVRDRHARYFAGVNSAYKDVEALFLVMEGAGQWAAYRLTRSFSTMADDGEALKVVRDTRKYWSQEEGLALFLLIDALVPGWQARIFAPSPASPFELLKEALKGSAPSNRVLPVSQKRSS